MSPAFAALGLVAAAWICRGIAALVQPSLQPGHLVTTRDRIAHDAIWAWIVVGAAAVPVAMYALVLARRRGGMPLAVAAFVASLSVPFAIWIAITTFDCGPEGCS